MKIIDLADRRMTAAERHLHKQQLTKAFHLMEKYPRITDVYQLRGYDEVLHMELASWMIHLPNWIMLPLWLKEGLNQFLIWDARTVKDFDAYWRFRQMKAS